MPRDSRQSRTEPHHRQRGVRRNTHLTEGRTKLTPFPADVMKRFAPMRAAADRL
jgi:hypothetical protein